MERRRGDGIPNQNRLNKPVLNNLENNQEPETIEYVDEELTNIPNLSGPNQPPKTAQPTKTTQDSGFLEYTEDEIIEYKDLDELKFEAYTPEQVDQVEQIKQASQPVSDEFLEISDDDFLKHEDDFIEITDDFVEVTDDFIEISDDSPLNNPGQRHKQPVTEPVRPATEPIAPTTKPLISHDSPITGSPRPNQDFVEYSDPELHTANNPLNKPSIKPVTRPQPIKKNKSGVKGYLSAKLDKAVTEAQGIKEDYEKPIATDWTDKEKFYALLSVIGIFFFPVAIYIFVKFNNEGEFEKQTLRMQKIYLVAVLTLFVYLLIFLYSLFF